MAPLHGRNIRVLGDTSFRLKNCLDRLQAGEEAARNELLTNACQRLQRLTRKMFREDDPLRRLEESDDVFQNAMLRLCRALTAIIPDSVPGFFALAALQIRRELVDLARHYFGRAHKQETQGPCQTGESTITFTGDQPDPSHDPARLAAWTEFHEQAGALPEEEKEVFDLVWYQGLTRAEAATVLSVSTKTVQRRWQSACLRLHQVLQGRLPGL
jgi:RNA polymerase sigma-70 factor (ECF subfamily)